MTEPPATLPARIAFRIYKSVLSPILHTFSSSQCLYLPTCSEYAYIALSRFGVVRGSWLTLRRVARCHPFAKGGLDPVPDPVPNRNSPSQPHVSIHTDRLP
jgi:putative membrane protein insertion efficiency factor